MMVHRRNVDSLFDVPPHLLEVIKRETAEDDAKLRHVEALLERWVCSQKHLPHDYDRTMAKNFVRGAKFNLDITKKKLEGYFLAKHAFPEFYQDRDPLGGDIVKAFENVNIVRLPKLTENGERICFVSLVDSELQDFDLVASIKLFWMLYDLTLTGSLPVVAEVLVFDCAKVTPGHLVKLLGAPFKDAIAVLRDAYAARVSQLHVINCPAMVEKLIAAVRPLLPEKVRKRFTVHRGSDSLFGHIHPKLLPADVGGDLESLRGYMKKWQELVVENSDWFRQQNSLKISGTPPKRIEKFSSYGVEGSFRQLNID